MPVWLGEVEVTNEVQLASTASIRDGAVEAVDDLCISVQPFFYDLLGVHGRYAGVLNQAVTDDATNYVYLDDTATLTLSTVSYPVGTHIRLARVIAAGGFICKIFYERAFLSASLAQSSTVLAVVDPTVTDDAFVLGTHWINTVLETAYVIVDNSVGAAIWVQVGGLGANLEEYAETNASITTPSAAFVEALKLTTTSLPAGDYLISWYFEVKNDTLNGITRTRVQLDDSAVESDLSFADMPITTDVTHEAINSGLRRVTLGAGVHTIDIDFFPFTGTTGEVRRRRINIRRVS